MRESYDTLVDVFKCIENFTSRLKIYTEIQPTPVMIEMMVKIMVELLAVLALATKQINQGKLSTSRIMSFDGNRWFDSLQRNSQESYWERKTSNQFFSVSTDSPSRSRRWPLPRRSMWYMVWSITCKWWWKVSVVHSYRRLCGTIHKSRWEGINRRYQRDPWCV